jgi:hypothetical protein
MVCILNKVKDSCVEGLVSMMGLFGGDRTFTRWGLVERSYVTRGHVLEGDIGTMAPFSVSFWFLATIK